MFPLLRQEKRSPQKLQPGSSDQQQQFRQGKQYSSYLTVTHFFYFNPHHTTLTCKLTREVQSGNIKASTGKNAATNSFSPCLSYSTASTTTLYFKSFYLLPA